MMKYRGKTSFKQFSKNERFAPKGQSIIFENKGDVDVKINGVYPLLPGESTPTISMTEANAFDDTMYEITFDPATVGVAPLVTAIIIELFELNSNNNGAANCEQN